MSHYVLSCGAKGNYYTLRYVSLQKRYGETVSHSSHVKKLTTDYSESYAMAKAYAGSAKLVVEAPDSLNKIVRRSDVDWFSEQLDFGKYRGVPAKEVAVNDESYAYWVSQNGSQKWRGIFTRMANELPELESLKNRLPENLKIRFANENPDVVEFLEGHKDATGFFANLYRSYSNGQEINARALEIVRDAIAEKAKGIVSSHVGKVGVRQEFLVKVKSVSEYETLGFGYNAGYVTNYAHTLQDRQGNIIVYFGSSRLGSYGEILKIAGTVKAHDEYKGVAQTVISRPKVKEVVDPETLSNKVA